MVVTYLLDEIGVGPAHARSISPNIHLLQLCHNRNKHSLIRGCINQIFDLINLLNVQQAAGVLSQ